MRNGREFRRMLRIPFDSSKGGTKPRLLSFNGGVGSMIEYQTWGKEGVSTEVFDIEDLTVILLNEGQLTEEAIDRYAENIFHEWQSEEEFERYQQEVAQAEQERAEREQLEKEKAEHEEALKEIYPNADDILRRERDGNLLTFALQMCLLVMMFMAFTDMGGYALIFAIPVFPLFHAYDKVVPSKEKISLARESIQRVKEKEWREKS